MPVLLEMGSVVRKGLGLLLGANTTIKYLDVGVGSLVLAGSIAESLLSLFKCVLSDHRSLFQGWPSQGFSAVSNPAHCLNITVSSRPSKICHLHWNNATSKLCFWESFGSKWNAAWNILSLNIKVSAKYNASCIAFIKHQVVLLSLDILYYH